jgi:hypothetical protein
MSSKRKRRRDNEDTYEEEESILDEGEEEEVDDEEEEDDDEDDLDEGEEDEEEEEDDEDDEEEEEDEEDEEEEDDDGEEDGGEEDEDGEEEEEEEDEDDGEEEGEGEDAPPEEDDEDLIHYFVQETAVDGDGVERQPGDTIVVKCKNCALWKREWAGEVHCDAGNVVNDEKCHPERFSCGAYFWPFDRAALLEEFLSMDPAEVLLVNRMRVGQRRLLGGPAGSRGGTISHYDWIAEWLKKFDREEVDPALPHDGALGYISRFVTYDDIDFPYEFFGVYADKIRKSEMAHKKRRGKPRGFRRGDVVEWTNLADGVRLNGIVMRTGGRDFKGQIRVACTTADHDLLGAQCEFMVDEWKRGCAPKVKVEAKDPEKM